MLYSWLHLDIGIQTRSNYLAAFLSGLTVYEYFAPMAQNEIRGGAKAFRQFNSLICERQQNLMDKRITTLLYRIRKNNSEVVRQCDKTLIKSFVVYR